MLMCYHPVGSTMYGDNFGKISIMARIASDTYRHVSLSFSLLLMYSTFTDYFTFLEGRVWVVE